MGWGAVPGAGQATDQMANSTKCNVRPDWAGIAQAYGFTIPDSEIEAIAAVLGPLLSECRAAFGARLSLVEPVGTFRPKGSKATAPNERAPT